MIAHESRPAAARVYVKLDMEGASGIVSPEQVRPGGPEYEPARRLMMHDLQAVLEGVFAAGCAEAVVYDAHLDGRNVNLEEVDPRARVILGRPQLADGFVYGLDDSFAALFLVGYHARAGAEDALMPHTYDEDIVSVRVNGAELGEIGLEAALAGEFGIALAFVSADSGGVREARGLLGDELEAVEVKKALSATSAICLPAAKTRSLLREAAARAVQRAAEIPPVVFPSPTTLEVEFISPRSAEALEKASSIERIGEATIMVEGSNILAAYRRFLQARHDRDATRGQPKPDRLPQAPAGKPRSPWG
jgi:D-amino peptidase